jgi:hypothetical protein
MKRRTALQVIGAGPVQLVALPSYKLQWFSPQQMEVLDLLTGMIIPADDHSPGAKEAKVGLFIDLMVAHSSKDVQEEWSSGLKLVEDEAIRRSGKSFANCSAAERDRVLAGMAAGEAGPETGLEKFFVRLKSMTVDGYYTSAIGIHRELQYKGNAVLSEFPGCRHSDH